MQSEMDCMCYKDHPCSKPRGIFNEKVTMHHVFVFVFKDMYACEQKVKPLVHLLKLATKIRDIDI